MIAALKEQNFKNKDLESLNLLYEKVISKYNLSEDQVNFYHEIVRRTKNDFVHPDAKIIKAYQNLSDDPFLYFIELGECVVSISDKDKMRNKSKEVRKLLPGEIFGEVAFLYNEKRTATVTSNNYCTLGKIPKDDVYEVLEMFPFVKTELLKRTCQYDDDVKMFLECALKTIPYLRDVPDDTINKLIYSMTFAKFDKGQKLMQTEDKSNMMQIVQNGMIEMYTIMDNGLEFSIERLYRGSVINHNSFLMGDKIDVNARCKMPVTLYYLHTDMMTKIRETCDVLDRNLDYIESTMLNKDNPIALDYIIARDSASIGMRPDARLRSRKEQSYRDKLTVKLKNAIMQHLIRTRMLKRIPNFNEVLNMAINKKRREIKAMRRKKETIDLDQLGPEDSYLTDE